MKKLLLLAGLALMVCSASAKKPAQKTQEEGYKFTDLTTVPTTSVKDQHRSGTCWCYSALSFLENEILRAGGPEMDLSEMWIVRNMYFDKGVKYVRLHGHLNFAEGGAAHDVIEGIKKYGIVPQEVYPGLNYGTEKPVFGELDAALKAYLDAVIKARNNGVLTTAWQDGLNALLDTYFGVRPEKFTYEGKEYTPESFGFPARFEKIRYFFAGKALTTPRVKPPGVTNEPAATSSSVKRASRISPRSSRSWS